MTWPKKPAASRTGLVIQLVVTTLDDAGLGLLVRIVPHLFLSKGSAQMIERARHSCHTLLEIFLRGVLCRPMTSSLSARTIGAQIPPSCVPSWC